MVFCVYTALMNVGRIIQKSLKNSGVKTFSSVVEFGRKIAKNACFVFSFSKIFSVRRGERFRQSFNYINCCMSLEKKLRGVKNE